MGGVTSFLTALCLDSLPGSELPSPSRDRPGQVFPVVHPKPAGQVPAPAGGNPSAYACCGRVWEWCWQVGESLPGQSCSLSALLSKNKFLTWTPIPFYVLVLSLSPSSQSRHSEPGAAPSTMEAAGSHEELGDGTTVNLLSSHLSIVFGNGKTPGLPTVYA